MVDEVASAREALAEAAASVTGPETPNVAEVRAGPNRWATWALVGAGPAISVLLVWVVGILAFVIWPDVAEWREPSLGDKVIVGVSGVAMALAVMLGLVVFRLASGDLKSVSARAGVASLEINAGDESPDVRS